MLPVSFCGKAAGHLKFTGRDTELCGGPESGYLCHSTEGITSAIIIILLHVGNR